MDTWQAAAEKAEAVLYNAKPLTTGYKVGEKVYYTGRGETFKSGDKLVSGQLGEVTKGSFVDGDGGEKVESSLRGKATPPAARWHGAPHQFHAEVKRSW